MVRTLRLVNLRGGRPATARRACLGLALAGALAGCADLPPLPERPREIFTTPITNRGHLVTEDELRQITPGVTSRADVRALLGSPSHAGTFSDDTWFYISSVSQLRPARSLAVRDQSVVIVAFDGRDLVRDVRRVGDAEMPRVDFVTRETPTPGTERTLMQALFGNVGRIGPGALGGSGAPGTGAAAAPTGR